MSTLKQHADMFDVLASKANELAAAYERAVSETVERQRVADGMFDKLDRLNRLMKYAPTFEWSVVDLPDGGYRYHGHNDSAKLIIMRNRDTGEWEVRQYLNPADDPSRTSGSWKLVDFTALVPEPPALPEIPMFDTLDEGPFGAPRRMSLNDFAALSDAPVRTRWGVRSSPGKMRARTGRK